MRIGREIKIGIFALAMTVCLYLGVNYLKGRDFFSSDKLYYALFDDTRGLQTSAAVLLRGVKVGTVSGIEIDGEHPDKVVVSVNIKKDVPVPVDSRLRLVSTDIMGGKAIELVVGSQIEHFERGAVIPSEIESGLLESASVSIGDIVGEAKAVMNSLVETSASLNDILAQNAAGFNGIVNNIESVTRQFSEARLDGMLGDLGEFGTMLKTNSTRLDSIIGNLNTISEDIAGANLRGTLDTLGMSIASLNSVLVKVTDGGGTVSRLLDDPALYDSLTVATGNLAALLEDLKDNPKRYVSFSLFGRKDKTRK